MKILGIYFTYDWRKKQELNFEAILKSLRKTLNSWQWRNQSFFIWKNSNSLFVWNGKDKIKRLALISVDYENGGLRMPHIETQRIQCLKKYVDKYSSPWKHFLSHMLKKESSFFTATLV